MPSPVVAVTSTSSHEFASTADRSAAIASLPLTQRQQQRLTLNDKSDVLSSIDTKAAAVTNSLSKISESFGGLSLQVNVSYEAAIRPTVSSGALPVSFAVSIQNLGSATTFVASGYPSVSDPEADSYTTQSPQTLTVNGVSTTLRPASNTLHALADEINKAGVNVRATIIDVGPASTANYQLSLQSTKLGAFDISLADGAVITANTAVQRGASVEYAVNGKPFNSDSRTVTLALNLSVDLLKETTDTASVTLTESSQAFKTALSSFVDAYNDVSAEVRKHLGNKDAELSGAAMPGKAPTSLRSLFNIPGGAGSFQALSDLGLGFDRSGKLFLDSAAFDKATAGKQAELKSFFGASDSGTIQEDRISHQTADLQQRLAIADNAVAMLGQQAAYYKNN